MAMTMMMMMPSMPIYDGCSNGYYDSYDDYETVALLHGKSMDYRHGNDAA